MTYQHGGNGSSRPRGFYPILVVFIAIAGFFLITEHRAHLFPFLPYLLLLACPLMHLLMHGGHGGHGRQGDSARRRDSAP